MTGDHADWHMDGTLNAHGEPFMYTADTPDEATAILSEGRVEETRTWWHETSPERLGHIITFGLRPGCWSNAGECAVFGLDQRPEPTAQKIVVEVASPAPLGDLKAWWVPPRAIMGMWTLPNHHGPAQFVPAQDIDASGEASPQQDGCHCALSPLCREQQRLMAQQQREAHVSTSTAQVQLD